MGQVIHKHDDPIPRDCFDQRLGSGERSIRMGGMIPAIALTASSLSMGAWFFASSQELSDTSSTGSSWMLEQEVQRKAAGKNPFSDHPNPDPREARILNAAIPFGGDVGVAAQPFDFGAAAADRDRAVDCLAIAAMAEAGEGDDGQRAVIQVVLNRVRHPSFPKTICGVVFEGSHRSTGCQFTFTCDGALQRRHTPAAWSRARARAIDAIDGRVYAPVRLATHYHTDWVHPYWSASLTKLARVDTHLFFGRPGYVGSSASFHAAYRGGEPAISGLAYLPSHGGQPSGSVTSPFSEPVAATDSIDVVVRNEDGGAFVLLTGAPSAEAAREIARNVCVDRPSCKVMGWFDRTSIPSNYPVPPNLRAKLGFSYFRSLQNDETIFYDCARFISATSERCLPQTLRRSGNT